jgi:hypothetical protein
MADRSLGTPPEGERPRSFLACPSTTESRRSTRQRSLIDAHVCPQTITQASSLARTECSAREELEAIANEETHAQHIRGSVANTRSIWVSATRGHGWVLSLEAWDGSSHRATTELSGELIFL